MRSGVTRDILALRPPSSRTWHDRIVKGMYCRCCIPDQNDLVQNSCTCMPNSPSYNVKALQPLQPKETHDMTPESDLGSSCSSWWPWNPRVPFFSLHTWCWKRLWGAQWQPCALQAPSALHCVQIYPLNSVWRVLASLTRSSQN